MSSEILQSIQDLDGNWFDLATANQIYGYAELIYMLKHDDDSDIEQMSYYLTFRGVLYHRR
jgi:hypothetical protein